MTVLLPSVRIALETLRANPLRTALSTLGIVMGAASLAAVLSLGDGLEQFTRQRLEQEGMQVITIEPRTSDEVDGLRVPRADYAVFTSSDADRLAAHLGSRCAVLMVVRGTGLLTGTAGDRPRGVLVTGVMGTRPELLLQLAAGRTFASDELRQGARVAVVSSALAKHLTGSPSPERALGIPVRLRNKEWRVIGVLQPSSGERGFAASVPLGTAEDAMVPSPTPRGPTLLVHAARVEEMPAVAQQIDRWVARPEVSWTGKVTVTSRGPERLKQAAQGILLFKILMGAFTAISLLVGGIGIMNVLLSSVLERTREIGVRKSVGASRRVIVVQFLAESVAISLAGSLIGVTLGLSGAFAVTALMRARTEALVYAAVTWQTIVVSALAALTVGLLFGTYPALRAARLSPVDAMRYE